MDHWENQWEMEARVGWGENSNRVEGSREATYFRELSLGFPRHDERFGDQGGPLRQIILWGNTF